MSIVRRVLVILLCIMVVFAVFGCDSPTGSSSSSSSDSNGDANDGGNGNGSGDSSDDADGNGDTNSDANDDGNDNGNGDSIAWQEVDADALESFKEIRDVAIDSDGNIYVAYVDSSYDFFVARYDGESWLKIAEGISTGDSFGHGSMAINPANNRPILLYVESGSNKPVVKEFNGTEWNPIAQDLLVVLIDQYFGLVYSDVAADSAGKIYFTIKMGDDARAADQRLNVLRYDGTEWANVSGGIEDKEPRNYQTLVIDSSDDVYLGTAFQFSIGTDSPHVYKLASDTWTKILGDDFFDVHVAEQKIGLSGMDNPVLMALPRETVGEDQEYVLHVYEYVSNEWQQRGGSFVRGVGNNNYNVIPLQNNKMLVQYTYSRDDLLNFEVWSGSSWDSDTIPAISNVNQGSRPGVLAHDDVIYSFHAVSSFVAGDSLRVNKLTLE